ncbi:ATP-binding cassette domain-containing protein [Rhodococcus hoagii]|nr:ATP-binding cassette domain-containing protein [Prescottella equi]
MTLVLDDVTVGYPGRPARTILRDVRLTAHAGQVTALLGPNGAGKSTLLRSVAGLQRVLGGSVFLDGDDPTSRTPTRRGHAATRRPDRSSVDLPAPLGPSRAVT